MTKFFCKFKKTCWQKKYFYKIQLCKNTASYGFLAPCQNLEKTNDTIPRKHLEKQKDVS